MSDADITHASPHDAPDGHDDGHGHEAPDESLGPVDVVTWGYAVAGGVIGLIVVLGLAAATGG